MVAVDAKLQRTDPSNALVDWKLVDPAGTEPSVTESVKDWQSLAALNTVIARLTSVVAELAGTLVVAFPAAQPVSGTVGVNNFPATQPVSGTVGINNFPAGMATEATLGTRATEATLALRSSEVTLAKRNGGLKSAVTASVSASGDTTLRTPAAGKAITLYWVSAIADPQASTNPVITIKLGGVTVYVGYAIAHWEPFVGAANDILVINLNSAGTNVAVTAHYTEA